MRELSALDKSVSSVIQVMSALNMYVIRSMWIALVMYLSMQYVDYEYELCMYIIHNIVKYITWVYVIWNTWI